MVTNPEADAPPAPIVAKGLENVVALESELSYVDGQAGDLVYRGYHIHDL
ncbi:MAG TPA: citrate/2-methylcitrate synthase, partial [Rhodothermales bacterium]